MAASGRWIAAGAIAVAAVVGYGVAAFRPAIDPIRPPAPSSFSPASVQRGAALARLGDCAACHTPSLAGGAAVPTPFGAVFSDNITPDPETGIGRWSLAAFRRALREGVDRCGGRLYPAMPFDHFNALTDADLADLYAFVMTRPPVSASRPGNRLIPPLGFRPLMAAWDWLFLRQRSVAAAPARGPDWNRGHYLVEALGHCGACHAPHSAAGAEARDKGLAGGWVEGWYAPPLDRTSPAAAPWTAEALYIYLRTGLSTAHAAAAGPMGPVARQLADAPESDVRAIAVYLASQMTGASGARDPGVGDGTSAARSILRGQVLWAGACAHCHEAGAGMMLEGRPALALGTPLHEADPTDTLQIILRGLKTPVGRAGPAMPAFADAFTDAEAGDVAAYIHARFGGPSPWPANLSHAVRKARRASATEAAGP
jgi:mono/diheme cytochrome c family protein